MGVDSKEARLWATLDCLAEGFQVIGFDWTYVYVNASVAQQGRSSKEGLIGRTMMQCYPGIERTPLFAALERCMKDRTSTAFGNEFTFPDGSTGHFELRIEPCPEGLFILSTDVTDKRRLDARLRQAQKLESLGLLAGGIAHDFANVLTAVASFGSFALEAVGKAHPARPDIEEVLAAAKRATALTEKLLAFARSGPAEPRVVDLNTVVGGIDKMLRRVLGNGIALVTVPREGLWNILADTTAIEQVVLNLSINARDAMPSGGRLTIETANVHLDEAYLLRHAEQMPPGDYVQLAVTDNGEGMPRDVQEHIFDPFFTTKPAGKGTGLGLSTSYGIVRQAGGFIWVYSEKGHGTTFKVYLPRARNAVAAPAVARPEATFGTGTVLLVDDDAQLRLLARRALERAGFRVFDACGAEEAVAAAGRISGHLHLLLTDVMMPGHSGPELAARISPLHPSARVLFMSGYAEGAVRRNHLLDPGTKMLSKPFTPDALVIKVREVLGLAG